MKILKFALMAIVIIAVVLSIIGVFAKKDFVISREVTINKPKQQVFGYIKLLKNQNEYSKWAKMDEAMKKDFRGTDGTVGFVSAWDSDKKDVGKGEQEIKAIVEGEKVDYEIRFIRPFESKANATISTVAVNDSTTKVTWTFYSHMNFPMNLFGLFMNMDKSVGGDLSVGLNNLKELLEHK